MKIELTTGCICDSLEVDGDGFRDLTATKLQELKDTLIDYLEERKMSEEELQDLVIWAVENFGLSRYEGTCDECGDSVYVITMTI